MNMYNGDKWLDPITPDIYKFFNHSNDIISRKKDGKKAMNNIPVVILQINPPTAEESSNRKRSWL